MHARRHAPSTLEKTARAILNTAPGDGFEFVNDCPEGPGRSVLLAGSGPIRLALIQRQRARQVAVVEPNLFRHRVAQTFDAVPIDADDSAVRWCLEAGSTCTPWLPTG